MRTRNAKAVHSTGAKTFRFQRISYLQRIVGVCANATGSFGALRREYCPEGISVPAHPIALDVASIRPFLPWPSANPISYNEESSLAAFEVTDAGADSYEDAGDMSVQNDVCELINLCRVLLAEQDTRITADTKALAARHGADTVIQTPSGSRYSAHKVVLAARSAVLARLLSGDGTVDDSVSKISLKAVHQTNSTSIRLEISGCHSMTLLILLTYLYTDDLPAIWDLRAVAALGPRLISLKIKPAIIKAELVALAGLLELPQLVVALRSAGKISSKPCMEAQLGQLYATSQHWTSESPNGTRSLQHPMAPDVVLRLADKDVKCHSVILRARSTFFAAFFDEAEWTKKRRDANGVVKVNLQHLTWNVMQYLLRYLLCGQEDDLFAQFGL